MNIEKEQEPQTRNPIASKTYVSVQSQKLVKEEIKEPEVKHRHLDTKTESTRS